MYVQQLFHKQDAVQCKMLAKDAQGVIIRADAHMGTA